MRFGLLCSAQATGDADGFRRILAPTVPLSRLMFRAPTQFYKTGVVFLAYLNGFQDHFVMLGGAQSMRPLPYFVEAFRLAEEGAQVEIGRNEAVRAQIGERVVDVAVS